MKFQVLQMLDSTRPGNFDPETSTSLVECSRAWDTIEEALQHLENVRKECLLELEVSSKGPTRKQKKLIAAHFGDDQHNEDSEYHNYDYNDSWGDFYIQPIYECGKSRYFKKSPD